MNGKRKQKRSAWLLPILLMVCLLLAGCSGEKPAAEAESAEAVSVSAEPAEAVSVSAETVSETAERGEDPEIEAEGDLSVQAESEASDAGLEASETEDRGEDAAGADGSDPAEAPEASEQEEAADAGLSISEDGIYTGKEEVAAYIHAFGHLPDNYITKREAEELGWVSKEGNLWEVAPGKSIGGSKFGNYEGLLPEADGRRYYECDIDFDGTYRNARRIIYSNDGLIFYTEDHYETFEQLY